jgi:SWI/SNF-related matrix-associated actin-dependent regulator 1 of chromatin subfamily A
MQLNYLPSQNRYVFKCSFIESDAPRAVGFRWDGDAKHWYTQDPVIASRLRQYATPDTAQWLLLDFKAIESRLHADNIAPSGKYDIPCPKGEAYRPFQVSGIEYAIDNERCMIGDEPGLGKTVQAIGAINYWYPNGNPKILIVTRASIKITWARMLNIWLTNKNLAVQVVNSPAQFSKMFTNIWIVSYSLLHSLSNSKSLADYYDLIVYDEAHAIKDTGSQQARAAYKIKSHRLLYLTGTPTPNVPHEIYPLWKHAQPAKVMPYPAFSANFIGYKKKPINETQLQLLLRSSGFLIRRLKSEVETELPEKTRRIIELPSKGISDVTAFDNFYQVDKIEEYHKIAQRLTDRDKLKRKELGLKKVPYVVKYVKEALEESPKIILFAHHLEVLDMLRAELNQFGVVGFDGRHSIGERDQAVHKFQHDPRTKLFIAGITAAKEGITLTAASRVIFAELDYVPGTILQAEDRAHRIGQKNQVLIEHLVFENSTDCRIARIMIDKQYVLDKTFNWG